jgi:hypothetical protein
MDIDRRFGPSCPLGEQLASRLLLGSDFVVELCQVDILYYPETR